MPVKITVFNNAPYNIEGEVELVDQTGNRFDLGGRTKISLCRCGGSKKKPFCDGSHRTIGFTSDVAAFSLDPVKPKP